jgi:hypothetical protein
VESDLGATGAGLASLAVLQQGRQVFGFGIVGGSASAGGSGSVKGGGWGSTIIIRAGGPCHAS